MACSECYPAAMSDLCSTFKAACLAYHVNLAKTFTTLGLAELINLDTCQEANSIIDIARHCLAARAQLVISIILRQCHCHVLWEYSPSTWRGCTSWGPHLQHCV